MNEKTDGRRGARAFSIIELMVVVAVIAVLLGILLPALFRARRSSVELASIAQVTGMFDTLMHVRLEEQGSIPGWYQDREGVIHSGLHVAPTAEEPWRPEPLYGFNLAAFDDPFRLQYSIANDPLLARLGPFVDEEHGTEGLGYLYVPFAVGGVRVNEESVWPANSHCHPMWKPALCHSRDDEPPWTRMSIPHDTEYLLWGVGTNGTLDGDPEKDVVLIKLPNNEGLIRHRPEQAQPPGKSVNDNS